MAFQNNNTERRYLQSFRAEVKSHFQKVENLIQQGVDKANSVHTKVDGLKSDVGLMRRNIETTKGDMAGAKKAIAELEGAMQKAKEGAERVGGCVEVVKGNVLGMQKEMEQVKSVVGRLEIQGENMQKEMVKIKTDILKVESQMANLRKEVAAMKTGVQIFAVNMGAVKNRTNQILSIIYKAHDSSPDQHGVTESSDEHTLPDQIINFGGDLDGEPIGTVPRSDRILSGILKKTFSTFNLKKW